MGIYSQPTLNTLYTPGAAASIDADEFELSCHSHSPSSLVVILFFRNFFGSSFRKVLFATSINEQLVKLYVVQGYGFTLQDGKHDFKLADFYAGMTSYEFVTS